MEAQFFQGSTQPLPEPMLAVKGAGKTVAISKRTSSRLVETEIAQSEGQQQPAQLQYFTKNANMIQSQHGGQPIEVVCVGTRVAKAGETSET